MFPDVIHNEGSNKRVINEQSNATYISLQPISGCTKSFPHLHRLEYVTYLQSKIRTLRDWQQCRQQPLQQRHGKDKEDQQCKYGNYNARRAIAFKKLHKTHYHGRGDYRD